MQTCIDWVSFSFPVGQGSHPEQGWRWEHIHAFLCAYVGSPVDRLFSQGEITHGTGRPPYAHGTRLCDGLLVVYWGGRTPHGLVEAPGQAMARIRSEGLERDYLSAAAERCTRIDLASDIQSDIAPIDFATQRDNKKHQAHASFTSKSGTTEYIGGRTSLRFARVYRYASPHPRSHLLRVEHELKREAAKQAIPKILETSVEAVQASLGKSFGWTHPTWRPGVENATKFKTPPNDRTAAKTELWLRTQAASAFKKLVAQGIIEHPEAWLKEVFLDELRRLDD